MRIIILWVELAAILYGVFCEISKAFWINPAAILPPGMGLAVALIGLTMTAAIKQINELAGTKEKLNATIKDIHAICASAGSTFSVHENMFYALWKEQVRNASNNVDVTNLAMHPPQNTTPTERAFFKNLKDTYKSTSAKIRRVERWSKEKEEWIDRIVSDFAGVSNFSLAILVDPSKEETPYSLSISRVDSQVAWIVAAAEHSSTSGIRDLMITGDKNVKLLTKYFEDRLWKRSIIVLQNGVVVKDWKSKIEEPG